MNEFYVYGLLDPRICGEYKYSVDLIEICFDHKPFYIGKGIRWRIGQHFSKYNLKKKILYFDPFGERVKVMNFF